MKQSFECYPVFIGGSNLEGGLTQSSLQPKSCDRLRCNDCDKRVIRFPNYTWKPLIDSTFLATQSYNPLNLQKGLDHNPGYSAYACHCKQISIIEVSSREVDNMNWQCAGDHSSTN